MHGSPQREQSQHASATVPATVAAVTAAALAVVTAVTVGGRGEEEATTKEGETQTDDAQQQEGGRGEQQRDMEWAEWEETSGGVKREGQARTASADRLSARTKRRATQTEWEE